MKKRAFTLIELIIVLSIISLLTSIMLIKFNVIEKIIERNEVNTILADINYCKEKSRVTGLEFSFKVDDENSYSIKRTNAINDGDENSSKNESEIKKVKLKVVKFGNLLYKDYMFKFKPTGSVGGSDTVKIIGINKNYQLSVGVAGASTQIKQ